MPSPGQFKEGFKVHKGLQLGGWSLQHITMGHEVVQQNERYRFPTTMLFERGEGGGCGPKQLLHLLQEHVTGERIIYSSYGSPYACLFGTLRIHDNGSSAHDGNSGSSTAPLKITCCGSAMRRRDIPTLSQQRQQQLEAQAAGGGGAGEVQRAHDAAEALKAAAEAAGYRVIKSAFGTSKCAECGEAIAPGERIAKRRSDGGRGGWKHLGCCGVEVQAGGGDGHCGKGGKGGKSGKSGKGGKGGKGRDTAAVKDGGKGRKRKHSAIEELLAGEPAAGKKARGRVLAAGGAGAADKQQQEQRWQKQQQRRRQRMKDSKE